MKHSRATTNAAKSAAPESVVKAAIQAEAPSNDEVEHSSDGRADAIRQTAYAHYEARGCVGGHELEDWLRAEAEFEGLADGSAGGSTSADASRKP